MRQILGALTKGNAYHFPAGVHNSGRVDLEFANNAGPRDQATIVVSTANGGQYRRDKLEAGTTRVVSAGMYTNIASIQNVGPSRVQVSLTW